MWPAMRVPLNTRPGVVPEPIEPGARWRSDWPCVLGPPRKSVALHAALEALALGRARHVDIVALGEDMSTVTVLADLGALDAAAELAQDAQARGRLPLLAE